MSDTNTASLRFPPVPPAQRSDAQRQVVDLYRQGWRAAMESADGSLGGPFDATLRAPELARRLAPVSDYFRQGTSLDDRLNEFAILIIARHWHCAFEWEIHCPRAIAAGLPRTVAQAVADGARPGGMRDDEAAVYDLLSELLARHTLDDPAFEAARRQLGEARLVDLVGVAGYYMLVAMMLKTANVEPAEPRGDLPRLAVRHA